MSVQIYVGNHSFSASDGEIRTAFSKFGEVVSTKIVMDRDSGRSKGFGFVEMADAESAEKAISALDGFSLGGRNIKVNLAKPKR